MIFVPASGFPLNYYGTSCCSYCGHATCRMKKAPGHAYWWQNIVYSVSSMAFIAAVVASARSPAKVSNVALPPEKGETLAAKLRY